MFDFFVTVQFLFGVYSIIFSLMMNTRNLASKVVFRIIPFCGGLFMLIESLNRMGVIF